MVTMCQIAGNRDQLIILLLLLSENVMNIILFHFQDGYGIYYSLLHYWWKLFFLLIKVSFWQFLSIGSRCNSENDCVQH